MAQKLIRMILAFWIVSAGALHAQSNPVVVELYTSQGCSSCPPADRLFSSLAGRDDVIPLSLHVDYWDYIGWEDTFADPAFTRRQKAYARAANKRMVYTPQMIIGGSDHIVGHEPAELSATLAAHSRQAPAVSLNVAESNGRVRIEAGPAPQGTGNMVVQLVRYVPEQTVSIRRGENAGRDIRYTNIVTSWQVLREWNGRNALSLSAPVSGNAPAVVIIQRAGHGPILAAARVR
ncbi:DUF1223 domain-containing protein [Aliiroseovarius sp. YM-037]|uniref:DUF1223 domain-containing protein n=1 Tax=Aliiroseovarius sp. YM-037 TaxID=3341728 RepID=UPI003A80A648